MLLVGSKLTKHLRIWYDLNVITLVFKNIVIELCDPEMPQMDLGLYERMVF